MTNMVTEALALSYSDGGFGVMPPSYDADKTRQERECVDLNETQSKNLTDVVRVRVEVLEVVERHRGGPVAARQSNGKLLSEASEAELRAALKSVQTNSPTKDVR